MRNNQNKEAGRAAPRNPHAKPIAPMGALKKPNWIDYWKTAIFKKPTKALVVAGLLLEVQPYEPIQPTYFIASRIINLQERVLEGTEEEEAHKDAVKGDLLAQVEIARECQKQRDIEANSTRNQCTNTGKPAGFCRHLYELAKANECPAIPDLYEEQ